MSKERERLEVLLTAPEVSAHSQMTVAALYNRPYQRKVPAQAIRRRLLFSRRAVRPWLRPTSSDSHGTRCPFQ